MVDDPRTVVIGAGPAGLALSCRLAEADVPHVVLERGRVGETWRRRWDSFCLVTPNWTVQLPTFPYDEDDPDGFMSRGEVVAYLRRYAAACAAPVREGVEVTSLRRDVDGCFVLETSTGPFRTRTVAVATGAYQRPHRPPAAATLPRDRAAAGCRRLPQSRRAVTRPRTDRGPYPPRRRGCSPTSWRPDAAGGTTCTSARSVGLG